MQLRVGSAKLQGLDPQAYRRHVIERVRRKGESFGDLVLRLDHAVDMAVNHDAPTDEINKR